MTRAPHTLFAVSALAATLAAACDLPPDGWFEPDSGTDGTPAIRPPTLPRVVAIGDLHGDLAKTREVLEIAGAIDDGDSWIGGDLVVVQTGDIVDRGPYDREILDLFERLSHEAQSAGGAIHRVLGNHEYRNTEGLMGYVAPRGFWSFFDMWDLYVADPTLAAHPDYERPRRGAFRPGEPYGRLIAKDDLVLDLDGTVYVHGSFLPAHAAYGVEKMNAEMRSYLLGDAEEPPGIAVAADSPMYSRRFGYEPGSDDCAVAQSALSAVGASRMVIGHTVQADGINSVCGDRVFRIDTGMSAYYFDGPVQALEIAPDGIRVLGARTMDGM